MPFTAAVPSSTTNFILKSGLPFTLPCILHSLFCKVRLHSGHLIINPEPDLISITVPSTSTSNAPPSSTNSWISIFLILTLFFKIFFFSIFLTFAFSSNVSWGIPFQDFTYPPVIWKVSPLVRLKSCHDVNWALPVSSPIVPEYTFFNSPFTSTSRSFKSRIIALISTVPRPDFKSFILNSLGSKASLGSLSLSVISIFTRSPKFSCTFPCHSRVYAFDTVITSPLFISILFQAVNGIVPLSSPRIP